MRPASVPAGFQITIREIIVDLVAGLLPGFIFVVATVPALILPALGLCLRIRGHDVNLEQLILMLKAKSDGLSSAFQWEMAAFVLAVSYVFGHLFYRQDPKAPDWRSVQRNKLEKDGAVKVPENTDQNQPHSSAYGMFSRLGWKPFPGLVLRWKKAGFVDPDWVHFPYSNLHQYLLKRKLSHLAQMVPDWSREEEVRRRNSANSLEKQTSDDALQPDSKGGVGRTKQFINLLKVRLEFMFPERYGVIARNEAHVRLMSSVWYCARTLIIASTLGVLLGVAANWPQVGRAGFQHIELFLLPVAILLTARIFVQDTIERVFHYQRIREIFFVLETACWASQFVPELLNGIRSETETAAPARGEELCEVKEIPAPARRAQSDAVVPGSRENETSLS
jgi:hypothetical protein